MNMVVINLTKETLGLTASFSKGKNKQKRKEEEKRVWPLTKLYEKKGKRIVNLQLYTMMLSFQYNL